jgi:hypothetical protein
MKKPAGFSGGLRGNFDGLGGRSGSSPKAAPQASASRVALAAELVLAGDSERERNGEREWLRLPVAGELPMTFLPEHRILVRVLLPGIRMRLPVRLLAVQPEPERMQ